MRKLLRWLIFSGLAPRRPWVRRLAKHYLYRYNVYGDSVIDLGPRATARQVRTFSEWWKDG